MSFLDILLIIISSAGLLHGALFAFYLIIFKKKKTLPNLILGFILLCMAFRIGKSVMLNFGQDLEPVFIFIGLTFLLLIGPLLRSYVLSMMRPNYKLTKYYAVEFLPFLIIFIASLFVTKEWYENSKLVIIVFSSTLIFIYLHFAFYIFLAWKVLKNAKKKYNGQSQTKSQKAVLHWLQFLCIGFVLIWISYVLNILDEAVPYVVGPIVYSIVIYFLSFKAYQFKATEIDGNVFKETNNDTLFNSITKLVIDKKLYLEPDVSLAKIGKLVGVSTQKISAVINQYAQHNFNDFINYYRIQEVKKLLLAAESKKYTISSIAFETGFSSLSSFNSAFKKFEGVTPSVFRKRLS